MIRVEITFIARRQVRAFKRGLEWPTEKITPLTLVVVVPAPFDDVLGVRDALEAVPGPLSWRILEESKDA